MAHRDEDFDFDQFKRELRQGVPTPKGADNIDTEGCFPIVLVLAIKPDDFWNALDDLRDNLPVFSLHSLFQQMQTLFLQACPDDVVAQLDGLNKRVITVTDTTVSIAIPVEGNIILEMIFRIIVGHIASMFQSACIFNTLPEGASMGTFMIPGKRTLH